MNKSTNYNIKYVANKYCKISKKKIMINQNQVKN